MACLRYLLHAWGQIARLRFDHRLLTVRVPRGNRWRTVFVGCTCNKQWINDMSRPLGTSSQGGGRG